MTPMRSFIDDLLDSDDAGRRERVRARLRVTVSEDLALQLEAQQMSRADLACRLGITRSAVTQALTDSRNLSLNKLADIAEALDLDVRVLLVSRRPQTMVAAEPPAPTSRTLSFQTAAAGATIVQAGSDAESLTFQPAPHA